MTDLLEHVAEPIATLSLARDLLRPGGVLMVVTPDTHSLSRRLMGRSWTQYKVEHLTYWNRPLMASAATQLGFRPLSMRAAVKVMTLAYLRTQFAVYPHPLLAPLARVTGVLPAKWQQAHIPLAMGEFTAFLAK